MGATVKINENGQAVEHIVVHQGLPSSMYDASCEGTWCLRKDIAENRAWDSESSKLETSDIQTYLNGDWMNRYDPDVAEAIKQVKIPYCVGGGSAAVNSGANGFNCNAFLLSGKEVGWDRSDHQYFPNDGAKLDYFIDGTSSLSNSRRVATLDGIDAFWWLRSPTIIGGSGTWVVRSEGDYLGAGSESSHGVRPCIILPYSFKFKEVS